MASTQQGMDFKVDRALERQNQVATGVVSSEQVAVHWISEQQNERLVGIDTCYVIRCRGKGLDQFRKTGPIPSHAPLKAHTIMVLSAIGAAIGMMMAMAVVGVMGMV